jgi:LemA protein
VKNLFKAILVISMLVLTGCGYNQFQSLDEEAKASWSEMLNQYQRSADLIPSLVKTVKGYAEQEKEMFTEVTKARASVGGIQMTLELLNDPAAIAKFEVA